MVGRSCLCVHITYILLQIIIMNPVTEERKSALTKSMAIIGFVAAILFTVWLAVQVVSYMPTAFKSLASLADSLYNNTSTTFIITTDKTVVNAGEKFTISWSAFNQPGIYTFLYTCTEGVALSAPSQNGAFVPVTCETEFEVGDKTSLQIVIESEKQRFTDIPYTVRFIPTNERLDERTSRSQITIVNASIPTSQTTTEVLDETPSPEVEPVTETPVATPIPAPILVPEVIREVIYEIPTSDPNGKIDLAINFEGTGILLPNKTFIRTAVIGTNQTGALRFTVQNLGTKTATDWNFVAKLPAGIIYTSKDQVALRPNEKAIITIGFDGLTKASVEAIGVALSVTGDVVSSNNQFTSVVTVIK